MAIGDISLTASARANLTALQTTASLLSTTQEHLSTGKKVNSALDNATSYFASQGFLNSANDLSGLKDSMSTALQTIKSASDAITSITNVVTQLQGVVNSAAQSQDDATRASYATQYNSLMGQLDSLANDASFNGTNLVNSAISQLKVVFDSTNTTNLIVGGSNLKSAGLGVGAAQNSFATGALAQANTLTGTVVSTTAGVTGAYNGTLNMTNNITNGVAGGLAGSGNGASIASNAADVTGGVVTDGATVNVASTYLTGSAGGTFLETQLGGLTLTAGNAMIAGANITATSIQGQFTSTGTAATAKFASASNTLTAGADGDTNIVIAAGQSIQVNFTQAGVNGGNATTAVYTNQSTSNVTLTMGVTGGADTVTMGGAAGNTNATASYNLTGGTVSYTGLALASGQTLNGANLIDAGGETKGMAVTAYSTTSGTGQPLGTTTTAGVNAYDASNSTLSAITVTNVKGTKSGTAAVTYALAAGSTLTASNLTQVNGSNTSVVADAVQTAQNQLSNALNTLRSAGASLGNNNTLVQTRQNFTTSMMGDLQTASDNLILADTNEEGANMQALQAQDQLGIVSLGISGQLAQGILKIL